MAVGDYDNETRSDTVYVERRTRQVRVDVEGMPKGTTEEVTDWRFVYDKPGSVIAATSGPWLVNKLDAMRQGIEYSRTGRLLEMVRS